MINLRSQIVLWVIFLSAVLCRREIVFLGIRGVSMGDVLLGVATGGVVFMIVTGRALMVLPRYFSRLVFFWVWVLFGGVLFFFTEPFFSPHQFTLSFIRLSFYVTAFLFIYSFFKNQDHSSLLDSFLNFLFFNGLVSLVIVALATLNLPYGKEILFWGESEAAKATMFYRTARFVVAKGLFTEPSMLALFQTFGLGLLWLNGKPLRRDYWYKYIVVIVSVLLSFSVTGYSLLFLTLMLRLVFGERVPRKTLLFLGFACCFLMLAPGLLGQFKEAIMDRISLRMWGGKDDSLNSRLLASWNIPLKVLFDSPFWGAGLGNMVTRYPNVEFANYLSVEAESWIIVAYVLGSTGVIGAFFFLSFVVGDCRKIGLLLILFLSFFGNGGFLESFFWIHLSLFVYVQGKSFDSHSIETSLFQKMRSLSKEVPA